MEETSRGGAEVVAMRFSVERQCRGVWHLVAEDVEADCALEAVVRSSSETGTHRATPCGTHALGEYFCVPEGGRPEAIAPPGSPPGCGCPLA
ncbi:MAG: hypothetical protein JST31_12140 [Actinobacteria bacterium]|nr:hypothetical protein [Actinomycetota bacterium]